MATFRKINAEIKRNFQHLPGFLPAKASMVGSFPAIRFEGDMPVSLAYRIMRNVEVNFPEFTKPFGQPTTGQISFHMDGVVINWV